MSTPLRRLAATLTLSFGLAAAAPPAGALDLFMMSEDQEQALGAQEHPKMIAEFGGIYDDPELGFWVAQVGAQVAARSEYADRDFTFSLLDSPVVNAFALPGGYVYITRGLLALMNTEAELAGVLGHEIGHVTARHSAKRQSDATTANLLLGILGAATGSQQLTQIGGLIGAGVLAQYSQGQEYEADQLGVRYMAEAGYNPLAQADLLSSLLREKRLAEEISGQSGANGIEQFFATHPNTLTRVQKAQALARETSGTGLPYGRDTFLRRIDGMVYGSSREQGFVKGQAFLHPVERFAFSFPEGFTIANRPSAVLGRSGDGALVRLDFAPKPRSNDPYRYLVEEWAAKANLRDAGRIDINGLPAATGATQIATQGGNLAAQLVVVRHSDGKLYRLLFAAPPNRAAALRDAFQRSTYSFRVLGESEAANLKPQRLRVVQVQPGDTVENLARRMDVPDNHLGRFMVLNALEPGQTLPAGARVKLVARE